MAELITEIRLMINDPAGETAVITDQEVQDVLDQNAFVSEYEQLCPMPKVQAGGKTVYKKFMAHSHWESGVELVSGGYAALAPETSDLKTGTWTFAESQNLPVLVYGTWYDMHGAAGELWGIKAGKYAEQFDTSLSGDSYSLSQKYNQAILEAKRHRGLSMRGSGVTYLRRTDVAD